MESIKSNNLVKQTEISPKKLDLKINKNSSNKENLIQIYSNPSESSCLCSIHAKPLEAFCEDDLTAICISCIVSESHKGHSFCAINKAVDIEMNKISKEIQNTKEIKDNIKKFKNQLQNAKNCSEENLNSQKLEISKFFTEIKQIINTKEQSLLSEIEEKFNQTNTVFISKIENLSSQESYIQKLESMMAISIEEKESSKLNFLNYSKERTEVCKMANKPLQQVKTLPQISTFRSERELDGIIKELTKKPNPSKRKQSAVRGKQEEQNSEIYK